MPYKTDNNGRYVVHSGSRYVVVCAVKENGNSPAKDFLEELERLDKAKLQQFAVLFQRIGQDGRISNKEVFRHEEAEIWSFKRFQHRLPCFRDDNCFVLTHGFVKKESKWPRSEHDKAASIRADDLVRVSKLKKKGLR